MKRLLIVFLLAALVATVPVAAQQRTSYPSSVILDAATTTATGEVKKPPRAQATFQAYGTTSAGSGATTIVIEVSNIESPVNSTNVDWMTVCTISLTLGTTRTSDGCTINAPWRNVRARVTAISGTNATVYVRMGS